MRVSLGYNHWYDPDRIHAFATEVGNKIPKFMAMLDVDTMVMHGNSGISIGFAAVALMRNANVRTPKLAVVRKDNDSSHGDPIEGSDVIGDYFILDDFVATGNTIRRVTSKIALLANQRGLSTAPKCKGVLVYSTDACGRITLDDGESIQIWSSYVHE